MDDKITFQAPSSRRFGLLADDASREQKVSQWAEEDHAKLLALCQLRGIKHGPSMFYLLALELARDLYPEPKKRGRKSKWTTLNKGALVVEVERLVMPDNPARGVAWACTQLAKREPWASFLESNDSGTSSPDPAEALRQIYFDFRNDRWATVSRDAYRFHEHEGTLTEWESLVLDAVENSHRN